MTHANFRYSVIFVYPRLELLLDVIYMHAFQEDYRSSMYLVLRTSHLI